MRIQYLSAAIFLGLGLADVLTTINGQQCTVRSSVIPVIPGQTSTGNRSIPGQTNTDSLSVPSQTNTDTGPLPGQTSTNNRSGITVLPTSSTITGSNVMTDSTGSSVPTSTGDTSASTTDSSNPATTTTADRSGTVPLPGPVATNANGVPVYTDRAVCGAIYEIGSADFYGVYCDAAVVSNTLLSSYTMNADLSPADLNQCIASCSLISNPTVPNGICEGAVFYNGTDSDSPVCRLYGAATSNKRDTQDSSLNLIYAIDSYTGYPLSSIDSELPPAPGPPGQEPSSTTFSTPAPTTPIQLTSSTITSNSYTTPTTPNPTVSASPSPSSNGTSFFFAMKPRKYDAPRHAVLDVSYIK